MLVVLISCVALAIDNPHIEPGSELAELLAKADVGLTAFFALEAALKMFVCGVFGELTLTQTPTLTPTQILTPTQTLPPTPPPTPILTPTQVPPTATSVLVGTGSTSSSWHRPSPLSYRWT